MIAGGAYRGTPHDDLSFVAVVADLGPERCGPGRSWSSRPSGYGDWLSSGL